MGFFTVSRRARRMCLAVALVAGIVAAGCGDDGGEPSASSRPTTTANTTTTIANTTSSAGASPTSGATTTTATANDDASVRAAFTTFFDGSAKVDARVAALDDGERYRDMLVGASTDPQATKLRASVRSVTFPAATECVAASAAPPCAIVTFDLLLGSFPALAGHQGAATKRSGTWKVTAATWCDVVKIGGDSCPT